MSAPFASGTLGSPADILGVEMDTPVGQLLVQYTLEKPQSHDTYQSLADDTGPLNVLNSVER